jgi:hypothetical protein
VVAIKGGHVEKPMKMEMNTCKHCKIVTVQFEGTLMETKVSALCPLHATAPELLKAALTVLADHPEDCDCPAEEMGIAELRVVVAKARGR